MKKRILTLFSYVAGFIFILYMAIWISSPLISSYVIKQQLAPYKLSMNDQASVRYNPFISQVIIKELQLNNSSETVAKIGELKLEVSLLRLLFKQLYVSSFDIAESFIKVEVNQEQLTIAGFNLPNTTESLEKQPKNNDANNQYSLSMPSMLVKNFTIDANIDEKQVPVTINQLTIENVMANQLSQHADVTADVEFIKSQIAISASLQLAKTKSDITSNIAINHADLSRLKPWLPTQLDNLQGELSASTRAIVQLTEGKHHITLNDTSLALTDLVAANEKIVLSIAKQQLTLAQINAVLADNALVQLQGNGKVVINNITAKNTTNSNQIVTTIDKIETSQFELSAQDSTPMVTVEQLSLNDAIFSQDLTIASPAFTQFSQLHFNNVSLSNTATIIETISLHDLSMNAQIDNNKVLRNLAPINELSSESANKSPTVDPTSSKKSNDSPYHIALNKFELVGDGKIHFEDASVEPNYQRNFIISNFNFGPLDNQLPDQESRLTVVGRSNEYATFKVNGSATPFAAIPSYTLDANVNELSLPAVSAYIKDALQYEIKSGQLNVVLNANLTGKKVSGETNILLRGLDFTAADDQEVNSLKDQTAIPFSVALGMLKDSQGNVELTIPLSGNTDDPSFGASGFIGLIIKQATMLAAKDYLMTTFVPYAKVVSIAMSAGEQLLKVRFNDLVYSPKQFDLNENHQDFLQQFATLLKDKSNTQVTICPIATAADLGLPVDKEISDKEQLQQLTELSLKRFHQFKNIMVNQYQLASSRLLVCTPQIDSAKKAQPRLVFSTQ